MTTSQELTGAAMNPPFRCAIVSTSGPVAAGWQPAWNQRGREGLIRRAAGCATKAARISTKLGSRNRR